MTELAHSQLGPSSADRWINCPGSVAHTATLPDEDSKFAAEGTAAHLLAEWLYTDKLPAETYIGSIIQPKGSAHSFVVDEEMIESVQSFLDYVDELPQGERLIEKRVSYEPCVPGGFGTCDAGVVMDGVSHVVDLKYGKGIQVSARDNSQLKLYALGILLEFSYLYDIDGFQLHIYQPRLGHIDKWYISTIDLLKWADTIARPAALCALGRAKEPAHFKAGDWCAKGFCKARSTCMVRASAVMGNIAGEFDDLDSVIELIAEDGVPLPSEQAKTIIEGEPFLGNAQAARLLEKVVPFVKAWCKDLEHYALTELAAGRSFGEYKIVEGRSKRTWQVSPNELLAIAAKYGLDSTDLFEPQKLLSVPKVEKEIGKKHELLKLRGVVYKPPGKPTLAPGSDPREPISNLDDFAALSEVVDSDNEGND